MDGTPARVFPVNSWPDPAHRWFRGLWLHVDREPIVPAFHDDLVKRVKEFLEAGGIAERGKSSLEGERSDPVLAEAHRLYSDALSQDRWRLEAYLLTDAEINIVAEHCAIPPETVQTYHDVFFDVRPRRDARAWICSQAIRAGDPGSVWKSYAYSAGPLALEVIIAVSTNAPFSERVRASFLTNAEYEEARLRLLVKLSIAGLTAKSATELGRVVEAREQLRRLDRDILGIEESAGLMPAMGEFLGSLGGRKGKESRKRSGRKQSTSKATSNVDSDGKPDWRKTMKSLFAAVA